MLPLRESLHSTDTEACLTLLPPHTLGSLLFRLPLREILQELLRFVRSA
jgi:hypothetical protein